jgi:ABC-2 type transport system ATP-binding protein
MMALLRRMAREGRTILFSSHILEEVERLSDRVLVVVAGRLAASGDFRRIRRLMTDRPHRFTVRSTDDRALARELLAVPSVEGVDLRDGMLSVNTGDYGELTRAVAPAAQRANVSILELHPADESLESVFGYLVRR